MDKAIQEALSEIDSTNPYATFLDRDTLSTVSEHIDTGSMPLNAIISGSLYGGIPKHRLTMLAGESMCLTAAQKIKIYKFRSKSPDILTELKCFYSSKEISYYIGISEQTLTKYFNNKTKKLNSQSVFKLTKMFNGHADIHAVEIPIGEFIESNAGVCAISTPDGYQLIAAKVIKPSQKCLRIKTSNSKMLECAAKHLVQSSDGKWVLAEDLSVKDNLLTEDGPSEVVSITPLPKQKVYDLTVDHPNHRYWAGGLSNHNTGKSYILMKILANAQKQGLTPVIYDSENAIDKQFALNIGLNPEGVKYVPSFSIEETRNSIYRFLTKAKEAGLEGKFIVVVDSLGNLLNDLGVARMEKDKTSMDMGTRARAIKSLLNTCTMLAAYTKTTMIFTNHTYDNPTEMYESIIKQQPGGKSVVYLPSVTVQLARKPEKSDEGKTTDSTLAVAQRNFPGAIIRALTVKNRFIQQYLQVELYLSFRTGLDKHYGLLDLAVGFGAVISNGATYTLPSGEKLGYYRNWRKDEAVWAKILPTLEEKMKAGWSYAAKGIADDAPDESSNLPKLVTTTPTQPIEVAHILNP